MSINSKYFIINGDNAFIVWEHDTLGRVLVVNENIDLNAGFTILEKSEDGTNFTRIKHVELAEFLLEILPGK